MKVLYIWTLSFSLFLTGNSNAWGQLISTSDHSVNATALSHSSIAYINNQSLFNNIGAASMVDQTVINLNGGMLYGLPELKVFQAGTAVKLTESDFGVLSIGSFGDINYRENSIGIGYSRRLTEKIGIGFKGNLTQLRIPEFGKNSVFTFNGGIIYEVVQYLHLGYQGQFFLDSESILFEDKVFHSIGVSFQLAQHTSIMLATAYNGQWGIQGGIAYNLIDKMLVKIGVDGRDPSFSIGLGYQISSRLSIEAAFQYHSALGLSPFFGMAYSPPPKTKN